MRIAKRRQHEQTEEVREKYRWRAGVEATMSQYDRLTGVNLLSVRGFKAVRFAAILKAVAVNIARAVAVQNARMTAGGRDPDRYRGSRPFGVLFKELFWSLFYFLSAVAAETLSLRTYAHNRA